MERWMFTAESLRFWDSIQYIYSHCFVFCYGCNKPFIFTYHKTRIRTYFKQTIQECPWMSLKTANGVLIYVVDRAIIFERRYQSIMRTRLRYLKYIFLMFCISKNMSKRIDILYSSSDRLRLPKISNLLLLN